MSRVTSGQPLNSAVFVLPRSECVLFVRVVYVQCYKIYVVFLLLQCSATLLQVEIQSSQGEA